MGKSTNKDAKDKDKDKDIDKDVDKDMQSDSSVAETEEAVSVGNRRRSTPFRRADVVHSIVNAGAHKDDAEAIAKEIEEKLLSRGKKVISPSNLQEMMVEYTKKIFPDIIPALESQTPYFREILVRNKKTEEPFNQRALSRNLEDTGMGVVDAYNVAKEIEARLRKKGLRELTVSMLDAEIDMLLAEHYGEHLRLTYRYLSQNRGQLLVMGSKNHLPTNFSKGILTQSLLAAGVTPDVARKVARVTHRDLRGKDDRVVQPRQIKEKVEGLLRSEVGAEVSARYRLLRVIRRPPRPLIVMLGGVSGTGKSFLAAEVAYRLGISRVVSTDSIREVMRAMVSPALVPTLHASTFNAWEALIPPSRPLPQHPSRDELMAGFREQVQQVSVGLRAVVDRTVQEGTSIVLEGVHLVPGYLRPESFQSALIVPILVTLPDEAEHHKHFLMRDEETAASRPLHRYLKYFAEIREMQKELELLAAHENVPLLDGQTLDESADQAVEVVLRQVMQQLTPEERVDLFGDEDLPFPEVRLEEDSESGL